MSLPVAPQEFRPSGASVGSLRDTTLETARGPEPAAVCVNFCDTCPKHPGGSERQLEGEWTWERSRCAVSWRELSLSSLTHPFSVAAEEDGRGDGAGTFLFSCNGFGPRADTSRAIRG